ncbi:MAG: GIY-YIG nuclease family protein [Rickettsiales bacterium]|nr:GIY-YIG nuclease family protein [Rickettsiales bacterium]
MKHNAQNPGGFVYIMADHFMGTIYIGVTSDLRGRVIEHKTDKYPDSFTARYGCHTLVWYREFSDIDTAIDFETKFKHWKRNWKLREIIELNPTWADLFDVLPYD